MVTSIVSFIAVTCGHGLNGNLRPVNDPTNTGVATLSYHKENRLSVYVNRKTEATFTYSGDGLKSHELMNGASTTIIWDGTDYLQGRS